MSEAVDVGSVLGGRYKVTAYVLASADEDLVLEGMDQVLNRPVSILVASEDNASQVIATARELASGERDENIQVLDLNINDSRTYLVTNRAPAADMLDLIVQREVRPGEDLHEEPFFTETLGSEIFGRSRSDESGDGYDDGYGDGYEPEDDEQRRPSRLAGLARRFGRRTDDDYVPDDDTDDPYDAPPAAASTPRPGTHTVPPPPDRRPGGSSPASPSGSSSQAAPPATSSDRSWQDAEPDHDGNQRLGAGPAAAATAGAVGAGAGAASGRTASYFPLSEPQDDDPDSYGDDVDGPEEYYEENDGGGRRFTRLLVGGILTVGIIVAVVFAATTLGNLNNGETPVADPQGQVTSEPAPAPEPTAAPVTPSAEPAPAPVAPVVSGISRVVPDNQGLDAGNDGTLPLIIDGDPTTFWGNQVYASDTFGGLASNLALVLELEEESTVSDVSITQISGSGGAFSVLLNSEPTLQGAEQVAQGSFTAPTVTVPIPETADGQPTAQYVIVNFTQLPRLAIQAPFPFGLRIAEIDVS
ncbi:hypothetical protein AC792_06335 [Arthrobacter sp. RIT-PI-e]|uniref:ABC transporter substrate-binding protein n=1 Tax=Arthrobacter sp. RIT-PI-e TaxID=1681197 RepID=UPI0006A055FC|nr:ABC transporter substrate-binding protein [Arthrobacter sp. RIT-PI-e]KNC19460.1 hypothetical protein AC792_06335 [Arthrobacter sp. RIT-PI-e]